MVEVQNPVKSCLDKYETLLKVLKKYDYPAVALSGGVDSTLLLKASVEALGDRVIAITSTSPIHATREIAAAKSVAKAFGVEHICFDPKMMDDDNFVRNSQERCYHCKRRMFEAMKETLFARDCQTLLHGVNCDDLKEFRPGLRAAQELRVAAPMVEAGLTKKDIRAMASHLGLEVADKPSMSCLATRIPYDTPITEEALVRIAGAEKILWELGFRQFRVRHHGIVARIEFSKPDLARLFEASLLQAVADGVKRAGYRHVAADLEGYEPGRTDREYQPPS